LRKHSKDQRRIGSGGDDALLRGELRPERPHFALEFTLLRVGVIAVRRAAARVSKASFCQEQGVDWLQLFLSAAVGNGRLGDEVTANMATYFELVKYTRLGQS
jgi:hypothetical protein